MKTRAPADPDEPNKAITSATLHAGMITVTSVQGGTITARTIGVGTISADNITRWSTS